MTHPTACHAQTQQLILAKYKHMQVHAHSLSLSHTQKHIHQGAVARTAAQLGSSTEEAALQWRSSQTPD